MPTLFAAITQDQHDSLRLIAFLEKKPMAEIARQAVDLYLETTGKQIIELRKDYLEGLE